MLNKDSLYVSKLLTNTSIAYKNEEYINELIMPIIPVVKDTAKIATYGMDNLRIVESLRAQGSWANEVNHSVTIWDHYILQDHALKEFVTKEEIENADSPISPKIDAAENLTDRMLVIKERELAILMNDTWTITLNTTLTWTHQWSDLDNSDPFGDIKTAIESVRTATWKMPNTFVMGHTVMMQILIHPHFIWRINNVTVVTFDLIKQALMLAFPWITNIYVGSAQYNSWVEGWTSALADIWWDNFWVMYIEPKPRLKSRSFGYTYQKTWENRTIKELPYDADREWNYIRINDKYDQKLIDNKCAYLIKDVLA